MASHFVRWFIARNQIDIHRVPAKVVEQAARFSGNRHERYLAARMLLAELMLRLYSLPELPELTITDNGKPHFVDPKLPDFSIAYSGNMVGVLLAGENCRAGLDMEFIRAHSRQTLEYHFQHFSSTEKAWINAQHDPIEAITQIWTLKQSTLKLMGENSDSLQLHPASGRLRSVAYPDILAICDVEPLIIWSCALSPGARILRLWEIDERHNWHVLRDIEMSKSDMGPFALRLTSLYPTQFIHY